MARLTLEQIWMSSMKLAPWRRNYSQSPKRQLNQIVPFLGTRTVLFTASFWGLTEKSIHLSNILVMDCEIIEEKTVVPTISQQSSSSVVASNRASLPTASTEETARPYGGEVNAEPNYSSATHFKVTYNGKNYWIKKIDMRRQNVLIRCSCSDYFYSWSWANYINGIQFGGRARPYVRKTKNYPPRNPNNVLGLCKHLAQFASMLQTSGFAV